MSTRRDGVPPGPTDNYNHDMISGITRLKEKRCGVCDQLEKEEAVHGRLKDEIATLNERL